MCVKIVDGEYVKLDIYGPFLPESDMAWQVNVSLHNNNTRVGERVMISATYLNKNVYEKCIEASWNADSNL